MENTLYPLVMGKCSIAIMSSTYFKSVWSIFFQALPGGLSASISIPFKVSEADAASLVHRNLPGGYKVGDEH